jgi:hypothetical protein
MISRRNLLVGAALMASMRRAYAALPVPAGDALAFQIIRKGDVIGTHRLDFQREGTRLTVRIAMELTIKLGPITLFRYTHKNVELWDGDDFTGFKAETNDDGTLHSATAARRPEGLVVESTDTPRYIAPPNTLAATHWNKRMLDGPMINTQDGKLLRPTVTPGPRTMIPLASGKLIPATLYSLTGDAPLDLWYDDSATWSALSFTGSDGGKIEYRRTI